jgi:hypothetical protein
VVPEKYQAETDRNTGFVGLECACGTLPSRPRVILPPGKAELFGGSKKAAGEAKPPSIALTDLASPRRSICAQGPMFFSL